MSKQKLEDILILREKIKDVLLSMGLDVIPLSLIFQNLGLPPFTGVGWALISGFIAGIAGEIGFEIKKVGQKYFLERKKIKHEGGEKRQ